MKLLLAAFAVLGLIFAPSAQATPEQDLEYLTRLDAQGITYDETSRAIEVAGNMCEDMDTGRPFASVVEAFSRANPGVARLTADKLARSAVLSYCPHFWDQLVATDAPVALS